MTACSMSFILIHAILIVTFVVFPSEASRHNIFADLPLAARLKVGAKWLEPNDEDRL